LSIITRRAFQRPIAATEGFMSGNSVTALGSVVRHVCSAGTV
jgi:hypothetical protein